MQSNGKNQIYNTIYIHSVLHDFEKHIESVAPHPPPPFIYKLTFREHTHTHFAALTRFRLEN